MIAIGSDHAGFLLKEKIKKHLTDTGFEFKDFGTYSEESCDYPVFAKKVCDSVVNKECLYGILVCGTGVGMSIAANKQKGIRAAVGSDSFSVKYTRLHNDANVLCFGARVIGDGLAMEFTDIFLNTSFQGGKHKKRIDMFGLN